MATALIDLCSDSDDANSTSGDTQFFSARGDSEHEDVNMGNEDDAHFDPSTAPTGDDEDDYWLDGNVTRRVPEDVSMSASSSEKENQFESSPRSSAMPYTSRLSGSSGAAVPMLSSSYGSFPSNTPPGMRDEDLFGRGPSYSYSATKTPKHRAFARKQALYSEKISKPRSSTKDSNHTQNAAPRSAQYRPVPAQGSSVGRQNTKVQVSAPPPAASAPQRRYPTLPTEEEKELALQETAPEWGSLAVRSDIENTEPSAPEETAQEEYEETGLVDNDGTIVNTLSGQASHVRKGVAILRKFPVLIDTSMMGEGKTYTTCIMAKRLEFQHMIVVCPVAVYDKWKGMSRYGLPIRQVISYQGLRSSAKGEDPRHGLLTKSNVEDKQGNITQVFEATSKFTEMAKEGLLLVLDEFHNAKNLSSQHKACKALTTEVVDLFEKTGDNISRVVLLSGTPIDKERHAVNMLRLMGIIRSTQLSRETAQGRSKLGIQELIDFCRYVSRIDTAAILRRHNIDSKDGVKSAAYRLFQDVVLKGVGIAMTPRQRQEKIICTNKYFVMNDEDKKLLRQGIADLALAYGEQERQRQHPYSLNAQNFGSSFGAITTALVKIESSKVNIFARATEEKLQEESTCKVVVFLNYLDSLNYVAEKLARFNPLILHGSLSRKQREEVVSAFQDRSLDRRLLISQLKVGSTGIDLDDKHGDRFRYAFASPNYTIIDLYQLTRRFHRTNTQSTAHVRFVYGSAAQVETSLLSALARKSQVMKETLVQQVHAGVKFPSDYADEYEPGAESMEDEDEDNNGIAESIMENIRNGRNAACAAHNT
eukprot:gb/GECG01013935.1/.p1 GENE.gb/GECG01013935.1/~~gb/GECG01013935.1/.p1  ORF type:complete len:818 (+),score=111.28 gb/GECG01013935.1/:1-2454(+)